MAFIRKRQTSSGNISTALVESFRDARGKPRQRVLANLHGCETLVKAIAKLAAQRQRLKAEKKLLDGELIWMEEFYQNITASALAGAKWNVADRKEINKGLRQREQMLGRVSGIEKALKQIERNGNTIKKHCTASAEEIQAEIKEYKNELKDAEALLVGVDYTKGEAKREYRRLSV